VLGLAYNGTKTNFKASEDFWIDRDKRRPYMIHAEANLLSLVKRDQCKMIAITHSPCAACATLIAAHNIEKVVYSISYEKDPKGLDILNFYNIKTEQIDFKDIHSIISSIILHKYSI
jgi:dCMP deaminase